MAVVKIAQVIIESSPGRYLVRCGTCGGDGRFSGTCHVCKGNGSVFLNVPSDWSSLDVGFLRCGTCGGDGRFSGTCHVCKGVGVLVRCFPRIICGTCGGDGRYSGTCHICKGSVYVENIKSY
jgi:hypothetical protein